MVDDIDTLKRLLAEETRSREEACFKWGKALRERDEALAKLHERRQMKAVYAGSFDPITTGHLSVIRQARICNWNRITVLVSHNVSKDYLFSVEERIQLIENCIQGLNGVFVPTEIVVDHWSGLVVEYAKTKGADVLIRGVRGESDIGFEMNLAQVNQAVAGVPTVFFPSDAALSQVSSSELKRRIVAGEDVSMFCMPSVYSAMKKKLAQKDG